jgi:hypothetical protein
MGWMELWKISAYDSYQNLVGRRPIWIARLNAEVYDEWVESRKKVILKKKD